MAERTCARCRSTFPHPWKLRRHLERKTPCAPILERADLPEEVLEDPDLDQKTCRFCGRVFSSRDCMLRHIRNNCKIAPNAKNGDSGMEQLYEHTIRRQSAQIETMQTQMTQMAGMMQKLLLAPPAGVPQAAIAAGETLIVGDKNVVFQDRRTVNINSININVFGNEETGHVTAERIRGVLEESIEMVGRHEPPRAAMQAVLKAALLVYSDPDYPENLTCYLPNKREGSALVHGRGGWEIRPLQIIAPPMAQRSVAILFDKQPFEDAAKFEPLMAELRDNEERYATGSEMRTILVRNKDLLTRALKSLPVAGGI
mgnify:CR=1 FL=1|jgi:hypothetical protein